MRVFLLFLLFFVPFVSGLVVSNSSFSVEGFDGVVFVNGSISCFNVSVADGFVDFFVLNSSGRFVNIGSGIINVRFFDLSSPFDDVYNVSTSNVLVYDVNNFFVNLTVNQSIIVDDYGSGVVVSNVSVLVLDSSRVNISWLSNVSTNSTINYGLNLSLSSSVEFNDSVINHSIILSGLLLNSTYFFNVTACDAYSCNSSGVFNFTTFLPLVSNVFISPDPAFNSQDLSCNGSLINASVGDSSWKWFSNYIILPGQFNQSLLASFALLSPGDVIICEFLPGDGFNNGSAINSSVLIVSAGASTVFGSGDGSTIPSCPLNSSWNGSGCEFLGLSILSSNLTGNVSLPPAFFSDIYGNGSLLIVVVLSVVLVILLVVAVLYYYSQRKKKNVQGT